MRPRVTLGTPELREPPPGNRGRGHEFLGQVAWQLAQTPLLLQAHLHGQTRDALDWRPADGIWSQSEVVAHLADLEVVIFQSRLALILDGQPMPGFDPKKRAQDVPYRVLNPFRTAERFKRDRGASLRRIAQLTPEDLDRRAVHKALGEITLANLLAEWIVHDLAHLQQIMVTAAQWYLPATGPWRKAHGHLEIPGKSGSGLIRGGGDEGANDRL